jgi:hypothetical protein
MKGSKPKAADKIHPAWSKVITKLNTYAKSLAAGSGSEM